MSNTVVCLKPAVTSHVVKALAYFGIAGLLLYPAFPALMGTDGREGDRSIMLVVGVTFALIALLFLLAGLRNLFALIHPPRLELRPEGITAETWGNVFFLGMFLPRYRMATRRFAWSDFLGATTYTYSVNLIPAVREVHLTSQKGILKFGSDHFVPNTAATVKTILDYVAFRELAPARAAARVAEFQRARWKESLRFPVPPNPPWLPLFLLLAATGPLLYATVFSDKPFDDGDWPLFTSILLLILAALAGRNWWECSRTGFAELTAEGLRVGRSASGARLLPWEAVAFARLHTASPLLGGTERLAKRFEVILNDGTSTLVQMNGREALERLYRLVEPGADRVVMAHALMAKGESAEAAAARVGLERR